MKSSTAVSGEVFDAVVHEATLRILEDFYPDMLPSFNGVWRWWLAAGRDDSRRTRQAGLPAAAASDGEVTIVVIIKCVSAEAASRLTMSPLDSSLTDVRADSAVVLHAPTHRQSSLPEQVAEALRGVLQPLRDGTMPPPPTEQPSDSVVGWVERWDGSRLFAAEPCRGPSPCGHANDGPSLRVDELEGSLVGPLTKKRMSHVSSSKLLALWLVLTNTHKEITRTTIWQARMLKWKGVSEDAEGARKLPSAARDLLTELLGLEVVDRAKHGVYYVNGKGWSWTWIRRSKEHGGSYLLRPPQPSTT